MLRPMISCSAIQSKVYHNRKICNIPEISPDSGFVPSNKLEKPVATGQPAFIPQQAQKPQQPSTSQPQPIPSQQQPTSQQQSVPQSQVIMWTVCN